MAFEVLVQRTVRDVTRYAGHLAGHDVADDIAQTTYLKAMRSITRFRGDSAALGWLLGITRHTAFDELRARGRRNRLAERLRAVPRDGAGSEGDGVPIELREAIGDLSPERREAFVLTQVLGLSYAETAEIMGCSIGTVRSRIARARIRLVEQLRLAEESAVSRD